MGLVRSVAVGQVLPGFANAGVLIIVMVVGMGRRATPVQDLCTNEHCIAFQGARIEARLWNNVFIPVITYFRQRIGRSGTSKDPKLAQVCKGKRVFLEEGCTG